LIFVTIKSIKHSSKLLYLFIDNDGTRYEYIEDFSTTFYVNHNESIINCDYSVSKDDVKGYEWDEFVIYNINDYNRIRMAINKQIRER